MAADGVVTAKASTGSGANNGGGLQITAVKGARRPSPRAPSRPGRATARSASPKRKRSASPKRKRSASPKRKRSASPKRKRSASPKRQRSASPSAALRVASARTASGRRRRSARGPRRRRRTAGATARGGARRPRAGGRRDGGGSKKPRIHFAFFTSAPPADAGLAKDILAHLEGLRDVALDARDAKPPLRRQGARTMADGDGADEAPPASPPAAPEPAPEPAPPPPPAPEVDDAPPEVDDAPPEIDDARPTSGGARAPAAPASAEPEAPAAPVDESAAARGPAPWPGDSDPTKLFVGALKVADGRDRARNHFSQFSEVLDAIVMKDRDTRQSRGFGFAEKTASATTEQAASAGIKKLYVANLTTRSTEQEMTGAFGRRADPRQQPQGAPYGAGAAGQQYGAPPPSQQPAPAGYAPGPQGDGAYAPVRGLARSQNPPYAGHQPY
ncbi:hypothetical protein SO694_00049018 [Aureococcus anophagefferens]|uniref:RRM domain-containing protein n=1 Tax=Aureococcus anophagefferens TaxID=44056 RepID=A0ABR1G8E6_AURAN